MSRGLGGCPGPAEVEGRFEEQQRCQCGWAKTTRGRIGVGVRKQGRGGI